uniref:Uncharacterized protein n=1 Tax=Arundo donax TaxID=35708 RepID=A0A0A9AMQ1_ARUDO
MHVNFDESDLEDDDFEADDPIQDVIGSSQLWKAPPSTDVGPARCHTRAGPLCGPTDWLTYSQGHVRAQGRRQRPKRAREYRPN